jgi:L-histidine N-alpha-methyltransferase
MSPFAQDVKEGLSSDAKYLSSRYFYDETGDRLFQKIMALPEYYLTDCEYEIFDTQKNSILSALDIKEHFDLVELGAGDGYKTKILLKHFQKNADFEYFPVDISANALELLRDSLAKEFAGLRVHALNHEYFKALEELNSFDDSPKVILFLGSNIGNFTPQRADDFFSKLCQVMNSGDQIICGIDLKKNPDVILSAYNDSTGITRDFNLNLLQRINRELGANFDQRKFEHYPVYNPQSGECRSYLISQAAQEVTIETLGQTFFFEKYEAIHMETSRKYSLKEIEHLAEHNSFRVKQHFTDSRNYFTDSLWIKE